MTKPPRSGAHQSAPSRAYTGAELQRRYRAARKLSSLELTQDSLEVLRTLGVRTGKTTEALISWALGRLADYLDQPPPGAPTSPDPAAPASPSVLAASEDPTPPQTDPSPGDAVAVDAQGPAEGAAAVRRGRRQPPPKAAKSATTPGQTDMGFPPLTPPLPRGPGSDRGPRRE